MNNVIGKFREALLKAEDGRTYAYGGGGLFLVLVIVVIVLLVR